MKQILQSLKSGETSVVDVPKPMLQSEKVLINTQCSLISTGTERMLIEFGKAGIIEKAKKQPDKVRQALDKIKTDGIQPTIETILNKMDQPLPLGYCNVGLVSQINKDKSNFTVGDRVVSNGYHAETVCVSENLCAKIPDQVSNEEASFTVLGAIALQGVRLIQPLLGEVIAVFGLGIVGLLTVQLLKANGCRVIAFDFDQKKLSLAKKFGAETFNLSNGNDPQDVALKFSRGRGIDATLVTATTKSSDPIHQAALMSRKKGRIVLVGVTGLELVRDDFYKKELTFQVSASYGPGRYDPNYEDYGQDYPIGYVRWTAQRNFEAFLDILNEKRINLENLISHTFEIDEAYKAYDLILSKEPSIAVLLTYPKNKKINFSSTVDLKYTNKFNAKSEIIKNGELGVSFIGSGNYASSVLIPAFKKCNISLRKICSFGGISAVHFGKKNGFLNATTDLQNVFMDKETNIVSIATRHESHCELILKSLDANKNIFVEKPLCLNIKELDKIKRKYRSLSLKNKKPPSLMVGFNRRFAPHIKKIKSLLEPLNGPKSVVITVNAGYIPRESWVHDKFIGGGRILGEACHFIDLVKYICGSKIIESHISNMKCDQNDTATINLKFSNGSIGSINYFSNGSKALSKERIEVFCRGKILQLDNFKTLTGYGFNNFKSMRLWKQDKGQNDCVKAFVSAIKDNTAEPINVDEIFEVSEVSINLASTL